MKTYNISLLSLKCNKLVLFTITLIVCVGLFVAAFQFMPNKGSVTLYLSVILAVGVCVIFPLKYILSKFLMREYIFEIDENGLSVRQGEALFYKEIWHKIPCFILGENRNIIMIKLFGEKKLSINANFFEIDNEKKKLREVMQDILFFTKTNKAEGKGIWYIWEPSYKKYHNPLYEKYRPTISL